MNIQAETPDKVISGLYKREGRRSSTWIVKARQRGHGKVVRVTIGRADVISVLDARAKAKQLLAQLSEGINPNEQKRLRVDAAKSMERLEEALKISLKEVLDAYLSQKQLKERTKQDYMETFTRNFSDLLGRPVRSLTRELLLERFQQIKKRVELKRSDLKERLEQQGRGIVEFASKPGVGEAQRAFRYLRSVLNSIRNDRIDGVKILEENPCDVISDKRLHQVLEPRDRYLNLSERRSVVEVMEIVKHPEYSK
jgi:cell division FtsZ-interacting protein ZapD